MGLSVDVVFIHHGVQLVAARRRRLLLDQITGIATGKACGVQIASLFLIGLDEYFKASLSRQLVFYKRYIGDIWVTIDSSEPVAFLVAELLHILNNWLPEMKVTHDGLENGNSVVFLDLCIEFVHCCESPA